MTLFGLRGKKVAQSFHNGAGWEWEFSDFLAHVHAPLRRPRLGRQRWCFYWRAGVSRGTGFGKDGAEALEKLHQSLTLARKRYRTTLAMLDRVAG